MTPDEQEALSIKYNIARIVQLSSGNYALFYPWSNSEGMPLVAIGSIEEITPYIPTFNECSEHCTVEIINEISLAAGRSLLAQLGLLKPEKPFERRV